MQSQTESPTAHRPRSRRPRLLLLISSGFAVRNYLRSGFLEVLKPEVDIIVMLPPGDVSFEAEVRAMGVQVEMFLCFSLPQKLASLNGLLVHADNYRLDLWDPYLWRWAAALHSAWKRPYLYLKRLGAWLVSFPPIYRVVRGLEAQWLAALQWHTPYKELFAELQPDLVLSTDPYSQQQLPVSLLALQYGLPTIGAIISWDNLTYKGHLLANYSHYIVWGDMMKEDLLRHRPDLRSDQIFITGTPQFDFHRRADLLWDREEFFGRIGGDPTRKLITYAANVEQIFPDEPEVVAQLWEAIQDGRILDRPQLLVRIHPHDANERFEILSERCAGILLSRPWPYQAARKLWFTPGVDDLALLTNTLRYTDVNVNMASSVTLDSAIYDKPIVNIAFTTTPGDPRAQRVAHAHQSHHYRRVGACQAVRLASSLEELIEAVNMYLRSPEVDRAGRLRVVQWICGPVDGNAVGRIARSILKCLPNFEHISHLSSHSQKDNSR